MPKLCACAAALLLAFCACTAKEKAQEAASKVKDAAEDAGARAADTLGGERVTIKNVAFNPQSIESKLGASVTWSNEDTVTHTVTSANNAFDSGRLTGGKEFSFRFTQGGEYQYYCTIHGQSMMSGVVKVT
jgi:plastocyanin